MPTFPSTEWFEAVRAAANDDREFRSLGTCFAQVGVRVSERVFLLDFEAFECAGVSETDDASLHDVDFAINMPPDEWRRLLSNIRENGGADSENTFNTLDIEHGIVESPNPYGMNNFPRYHLTIQRFFDVSSEIETTFA